MQTRPEEREPSPLFSNSLVDKEQVCQAGAIDEIHIVIIENNLILSIREELGHSRPQGRLQKRQMPTQVQDDSSADFRVIVSSLRHTRGHL